jgi:hypothetical protein
MSESGNSEDIVELRAVLRDDESGEATRALIQSLRDAEAPIAASLRGTLSREEYMLSEELLQALQTAESVLKRVWEKSHPDRQVVF